MHRGVPARASAGRTGRRFRPLAEDRLQPESWSDEELVERARRAAPAEASRLLDILYDRYYDKVGYWCLRLCRHRDKAAELAQEVFLRVHQRLDTFRGDSRFSTWLYTVTRSVTINRGIAENRRREDPIDDEAAGELSDPVSGPHRDAERREAVAWTRSMLTEILEPDEVKVMYLHYALGLTLPAITERLGLTNKSGAKAYIVSGRRKLKRRYGEDDPLLAATGRTPR